MEREREPEVDWIAAELARARVSEHAPEDLHRRILERADAGPARRTGLRRVSRSAGGTPPHRGIGLGPRGPRPLAGAVALIAALAIALILSLGTGGHSGPTVLAAAASLPRAGGWSGPASASGGTGRRAYRGFAGIHLPAVLSRPGWRTTGTRTVFVGGRALEVSGYLTRAGQVAVTYAVAARPVLRGQSRGYSTFRLGPRTVVSWQEAGHSCLLLSANLSAARLLAIASS
ncbi:hypothetical protein [Conexibacter sp. DBS9H8]|uniref:hypothetical protein n=1 Tax=Conexibacter sp. DBS9H8 TaxID=2937801 RepID=UPI00200D9B00|nr:hypothetical protein [Conexibacter sp. DBS9H8]